MISQNDLSVWFTYHAPTENQTGQYERIRAAGKVFAEAILQDTPVGPDQSAAIRKIREAVMTANQAIACAQKLVEGA